MASTSETGHAKNVANFESLISFCQGYGGQYNPSKESLAISKLKILHEEAQNQLQSVKTAKTTFDNATAARQDAFKPLKPLATRIVNALAVSNVPDGIVADIKSINKKLQGGTSTKSKPETIEGETPKNISTSQQSYDSLIDHFTKMIEILTQAPEYKPNEEELKTQSLQATLANLKQTNTALINSYTAWSNSRIARNSTLYSPLAGLVQTASDVKKYTKSLFGAASPQYKQIGVLEFIVIKD